MTEEKSNNLSEILGDFLFKKYANKNFGLMIKSEFEVILFYHIMQELLNELPKDKETEKFISDYDLSMTLGITESKVRNLRTRAHIYFGEDKKESWKSRFKSLINNEEYISYNPSNYLVEMLIPDVTLIAEIRHCLETYHLYDEVVKNSHLFKCPLKTFIKLCQIVNSPDDSAISSAPKIKSLEALPQDIKEKLKSAGIDIFKDLAVDSINNVFKILGNGSISLLSSLIS